MLFGEGKPLLAGESLSCPSRFESRIFRSFGIPSSVESEFIPGQALEGMSELTEGSSSLNPRPG